MAIGDIMEKYYATVSIKLKCLVEAEDMVEAIAKVENIFADELYSSIHQTFFLHLSWHPLNH